MKSTTSKLSDKARRFTSLLSHFAVHTPGVLDTVAVSSDGLLVDASATLDRADADRLSAIVSAIATLAASVSCVRDFGEPRKVVVDLDHGYLLVNAIGSELSLGVLARKDCDLGDVAYEIAILSNSVAEIVTPGLIEELKLGNEI